MDDKVYTLSELFKTHRIYWIKSYPTLKRWIKRDLEINNVLETKVVQLKPGKTGIRYYIPEKNVQKFIEMFNDQILYAKQSTNR